MANLAELEAALVKADAAGDADSARVLAAAVQQARAQKYVQPAPEPGMGTKANEGLAALPRQGLLTARHLVEGAGALATPFIEPLRLPLSAGLRAIGARDAPIPNAQQLAESAADAIGLPAPETPMERVAGKAAQLMVGAGLPIVAANKALNIGSLPVDLSTKAPSAVDAALGAVRNSAVGSPTLREVLRQLVANPATQLGSAGGAGAAGEYAKETGGNPLTQFVASLAGGMGTGLAVQGAGKVADLARGAWNAVKGAGPDQMKIDLQIISALGNPVEWDALPQYVKNQMRQDVGEAMKTGGTLTPDAVRRLADYRLAEAIPTRAGVTQDPITITQQRNLAKVGAQSNDADLQALARIENENARRLGTGVQDLAGAVPNDVYNNSAKVIAALKAVDDARRAGVTELYNKARDSLGRAAPLDPAAATQAAGLALAEKQAGGLLPAKAQNYLNQIAKGEIPFNVDTKEQIVRNLGTMARGASPDEAMAINIVRKALDDAPLLETHGLGPDALAAFRAARTAAQARFKAIENNPAMQAVVDGIEPDAFFRQFVLSDSKGAVNNLKAMSKDLGGMDSAPMQAMRGQIIAHLKERGGVNEQVGTFNQSSFNSALNAIGPEKLKVFFTPEEIKKLQAIGRVAGYEQVQPRGSAVNNSNTASSAGALVGRAMDAIIGTKLPIIGPAIGRIVGNVARDAAQSQRQGVQAAQAINVPNALTLAQEPLPQAPLLSPVLAGLLGAQQVEPRKSRTADALLGAK